MRSGLALLASHVSLTIFVTIFVDFCCCILGQQMSEVIIDIRGIYGGFGML